MAAHRRALRRLVERPPHGRRCGRGLAVAGLSYAQSTRRSTGPARGPTRSKWSASARWSRPVGGHPVYALVEWARTSEADGFFVFHSLLAEGAWTPGRHRLQYRFERTERPEEERISRFRSRSGRTWRTPSSARRAGRCTRLGYEVVGAPAPGDSRSGRWSSWRTPASRRWVAECSRWRSSTAAITSGRWRWPGADPRRVRRCTGWAGTGALDDTETGTTMHEHCRNDAMIGRCAGSAPSLGTAWCLGLAALLSSCGGDDGDDGGGGRPPTRQPSRSRRAATTSPIASAPTCWVHGTGPTPVPGAARGKNVRGTSSRSGRWTPPARRRWSTPSQLPQVGTVSDVQVSDDGAVLVFSAERGQQRGPLRLRPRRPRDAGVSGQRARVERAPYRHGRGDRRPALRLRRQESAGPALLIYDITDPHRHRPRERRSRSRQLYGIHDTFVRDGLAFVFAWNTGVIIYDVGNGIRGRLAGTAHGGQPRWSRPTTAWPAGRRCTTAGGSTTR